ncbi:MAG: hypothetical protein IPK82_38965 [Polyangiaceae bacterium]|nr:hypothetical protein [Polyangiaceae bacterium]
MENIVSKTFNSPLSLSEMCALLTAKLDGIVWSIRDGEYDDRYVKGMTSDGVKVRILSENDHGGFSVEVYFPLTENAQSVLSNADKRAFMKRLDGHVLTALKAQNVKEEG